MTELSLDQLSVADAEVDVQSPAAGVVLIEIQRPPNNFFDATLITVIADTVETLCRQDDVRAVVLAAQGKNFCAGADFSGGSGVAEVSPDEGARLLYGAAARLFACRLPIVAAVQGAAIGGGLGLALSADLRVAGPGSRFAANFARIGLHHGFGLTVTLPRVVGTQYATDLLLTGRRIDGTEALRIGLIDRLVDDRDIRSTAIALAEEIATAAPLAVRSIRQTLREGLAEQVAAATEHERAEQAWLRATDDFTEGVRAATERRTPNFTAR